MLSQELLDLAVRIATQDKRLLTYINGNAADLSGLATTDKTSLVAAVNEISAAVATASGIDDTSTGTSTGWSSQKVSDELALAKQAVKDDLTNGAPGVLDTLQELAAALGDDPNFASTITSELATRVRFDQAQTLTEEQKATARSNIGAAGSADLGNPDVDAVAAYESALA